MYSTDTHHDRHVVLDEEYRHVADRHDLAEHVGEAIGLAAVESRGRLVEQQHVERPREDSAPVRPCAAARSPGAPSRTSSKGPTPASSIASRRRVVDARAITSSSDELGVQPASGQRRFPPELHTLANRERVEEGRPLERASEPGSRPGGGAEPRDVATVELHAASRRVDETRTRVERGALPRPVGPDQPGDPARRRREAEAIDGEDASVPHGEVGDLDARTAGAGSRSGPGRSRRLRRPTPYAAVSAPDRAAAARRGRARHADDGAPRPEPTSTPRW